MADASLAVASRSAYRPQSPWGPGSAVAVAMAASLAPVLIGISAAAIEDAGLVTTGSALKPVPGPSLASPWIVLQMIAGQLLSLGIIWWAARRQNQRAETLRLTPPATPWLTAAAYGLMLIALIAPIELLLYRVADVGLFTDAQWLLEGLRSPLWWAVIFATVVLAPLWEELVFRGFLLSALAKTRLGFWPAAGISSALWALLHAGYSWPGLVTVFFAGIGLSWIMFRTGSMRAVVVAHALVNASSIVVVSLFAP